MTKDQLGQHLKEQRVFNTLYKPNHGFPSEDARPEGVYPSIQITSSLSTKQSSNLKGDEERVPSSGHCINGRYHQLTSSLANVLWGVFHEVTVKLQSPI